MINMSWRIEIYKPERRKYLINQPPSMKIHWTSVGLWRFSAGKQHYLQNLKHVDGEEKIRSRFNSDIINTKRVNIRRGDINKQTMFSSLKTSSSFSWQTSDRRGGWCKRFLLRRHTRPPAGVRAYFFVWIVAVGPDEVSWHPGETMESSRT